MLGPLTYLDIVLFAICFISGILTALVSGSGQQFTFTITPPAPVDN